MERLFALVLFASSFSFIHLFKMQLKPFPYKSANKRKPSFLKDFDLFVPTINLCLGLDPPQCFNLALNLQRPTLIIESSVNKDHLLKNQFYTSLSPTFKVIQNKKGWDVNHYSVMCSIGQDIVLLSNQSNSRYNNTLPLILIETSEDPMPQQEEIDGFIGLTSLNSSLDETSYGIDYSFVNYLYNTSQITRRSFMVHYRNNSERSFVSFGESYDNYRRCNKAVKSFNEEVYCSIDEVRLGEKTIVIQKNAEFTALKSWIRATSGSGSAIFSHFIEIAKDKCRKKEDNKIQVLICDKDVDTTVFPDIQLIMGEVTLVIKWKNVFKLNPEEGVYVSLLAYIEYERDDFWEIGVPGLIDNSFVYDFDNRSIGFLEEAEDENAISNHSYYKGLLSFCMVILIIGLLVLFKVKMNKRTF